MIIFISSELITIIFLLLVVCADYILQDWMLWITSHWLGVQIFIYLIFAAVLAGEVIAAFIKAEKKAQKKLIIWWFALWNVLRSFAAAKYLLFLISDLAFNYGTLGFFEKILMLFGLMIADIPLLAYFLFEIIAYEIITNGSEECGALTVLGGGLLSIGGIVLGWYLLF